METGTSFENPWLTERLLLTHLKPNRVIYFPIILNICLITHSMQFRGTWVITTLMFLGSIYLLCWDYGKLKHILKNR